MPWDPRENQGTGYPCRGGKGPLGHWKLDVVLEYQFCWIRL
jgi:hypothetical protein